MTVSLASILAPTQPPRGGEKSGREMNVDANGFDDALAGASARKKPALPQGNGDRPRSAWTIDGQAAAETAGTRMPPAAIRVPLAGELPGDKAAANAPDPETDEVPEEKAGEVDTDAALALLGAIVGKETHRPARQSSPAGDAAPAVKGSDGGDLPAADRLEAADTPTRTSPEAPKTVVIAAPAAVSELSPAAARTGATGQPAERLAPQREPARPRGDAAATAPARTPPVSWLAAPGTAATPQGVGNTPGTMVEMSQEKPAAPVAAAGEDTRARAGRPNPRMADTIAPRQQSTAQAADSLSSRVNVVGFNAAVAPAAAAQPLGPTSAGLVAAIEADPAMRTAAQEAAAASTLRQPGPGGVVQTLRIQLNPAELGMVTARLTVQGQQLSVEIQVETGDARHKLTNDSDAILKALRSVGYDIDTVTVQHAPAPTAAGVQTGTAGRDGFQPNQQPQGEGGARGQSDRGAPRGNGEGQAHGAAEKTADRARGDIYI